MINPPMSTTRNPSAEISSSAISTTNRSLKYAPGDNSSHFSDAGQFAFQPLAYTAGVSANYAQGVELAFDAKLKKFVEGTSCDRLFSAKPDSSLGIMLKSARTMLDRAERFIGDASSSASDHMNSTRLYNKYVRNDSSGKYDAILDARINGGTIGAIGDTYRFVCTTLYGNVMLSLDLVESLTLIPAKFAKVLLRQIDKLANFLDLLNNAWVNCLSGRLDSISSYVDGISMPRFDFTFLKNVAAECPQLFCGLTYTISQPALFKCPRTSGTYNGIDAISAAEDMINAEMDCLKDKIKSLLGGGVNPMKSVIKSLHDTIASLIRSASRYAKRIIGALVKSYLKLITKKRHVPSAFRWLFYDNGCGKVKRASLIDWYKALDRFSKCISTLCSLLSKEVREKIANLDLLLRLQFKWWKDYSAAFDVLSQLTGPQDPNKIRVSYITNPPLDSSDLDDRISLRLGTTALRPIHVDPAYSSLVNGNLRLPSSVSDDLARFYASRKGSSVFHSGIISAVGRWDSVYFKGESVLVEKLAIANELSVLDSIRIEELQVPISDAKDEAYEKVTIPSAARRVDAYKRMIV